ncbi:hypothetical protein DI53_0489 [Sphingobacterium deserti]|uniref:Uncharacterized protein n=1 Tax=Sphingobacterium deserti TaxID=1229276 RepID=A0A0B8T3J5_9SPHI|nr:hypothetical protein DI53_0489 [Sphingobacterium deserti]
MKIKKAKLKSQKAERESEKHKIKRQINVDELATLG